VPPPDQRDPNDGRAPCLQAGAGEHGGESLSGRERHRYDAACPYSTFVKEET
jgi:hypothetical protein